MELTTTLNLLHKARACTSRYKVLRAALGNDYPKDQPINLFTILESNGLDDALWAMCATVQDCEKVARLMAADFAEQVLPIWQRYSGDKRPELAIRAARDFAHGLINRDQLAAARDAAWDAGVADWDAARAARAATWAARAAAWDAARAARPAARAAAGAARAAAWDAACAAKPAARDAAGAAAGAAQRKIFVSYLQLCNQRSDGNL